MWERTDEELALLASSRYNSIASDETIGTEGERLEVAGALLWVAEVHLSDCQTVDDETFAL